MRKEDAWERFCCGRQGCLGEVRGEDWLGCFRGERGALVLLSLETAIIVVIVALCAGDSLLFTSDRRCARSGYIVVRQKHHPLPAGGCQVMWSTLCFCGSQEAPCCPARAAACSQSLLV